MAYTKDVVRADGGSANNERIWALMWRVSRVRFVCVHSGLCYGSQYSLQRRGFHRTRQHVRVSAEATSITERCSLMSSESNHTMVSPSSLVLAISFNLNPPQVFTKIHRTLYEGWPGLGCVRAYCRSHLQKT